MLSGEIRPRTKTDTIRRAYARVFSWRVWVFTTIAERRASQPTASDQPPDTPRILSMEVDVDDEVESECRIEAAGQVKYLTIAPGTLDPDLLSFPLASLPPLPYNDKSWTIARVFRDTQSG